MNRRIASLFALMTCVASCGPKMTQQQLASHLALSRDSVKEIAVPAPAASHSLHFAGGKKLYASWLEPAGDGGSLLRFASWDGTAWSAAQTITSEVASYPARDREPSLQEISSTGVLVARWFTAHGARISESTDGGVTWSSPYSLHPAIGQGTLPFRWVDSGNDMPNVIWINPIVTLPGKPASDSVLFVAPKSDGTVRREIILGQPIARAGGVSGTHPTLGTLVAFRTLEIGQIDAGEDNVVVVGLNPGGSMDGRGFFAHDGWKIDGEDRGIGPVLASRGRDVLAAWYTPIGGDRILVQFSGNDGRNFPYGIALTCGRGITDLGLAFGNDGMVLMTWVDEGYVTAERIDIRSRRASSRMQLNPVAGTVGVEWTGTAGANEFIVWHEKGHEDAAVHVSVLPVSSL